MLCPKIQAAAAADQPHSRTRNSLKNSMLMETKIAKKNLRQKPCFVHSAWNILSNAKLHHNLQVFFGVIAVNEIAGGKASDGGERSKIIVLRLAKNPISTTNKNPRRLQFDLGLTNREQQNK